MRQNDLIFRGNGVTLTFIYIRDGSIEIEVSMDTAEDGEFIEDITLDKSNVVDVVMEWLRNF